MVALLLAAVAPAFIGIGNVPDPVASHWGPNGQPDSSMGAWTLFALPFALMVLGVLLALLFRSDGKPTAEATAISGLVGGVAISISVTSVLLNWNAEDWTEAGSFGWWHLVTVMVFAFGLAALGYKFGKQWFPIPLRAPISVPELSPIPKETTWESTITVRWVALVLLPLASLFFFLPGWLKLIAPLYVVLTLLFSKVGVFVDQLRSQSEAWRVDDREVDRDRGRSERCRDRSRAQRMGRMGIQGDTQRLSRGVEERAGNRDTQDRRPQVCGHNRRREDRSRRPCRASGSGQVLTIPLRRLPVGLCGARCPIH